MAIKMRALAEQSSALCAVVLAASVAGSAMAGPEEVKGPGFDPGCFAPRDASVKYLKYPAKKGPF
jgi:ribose transport system substrate-binding protein